MHSKAEMNGEYKIVAKDLLADGDGNALRL